MMIQYYWKNAIDKATKLKYYLTLTASRKLVDHKLGKMIWMLVASLSNVLLRLIYYGSHCLLKTK
jgi:hypothetical protein